MWSILFGAWLSLSPLPGQSDTTSVIIIEWWHTVDKSITSDLSLYTITDSVQDYMVYNLIPIDSIIENDGYIIKPVNTYLYILITERVPYKTFLYCIVEGYGIDYFRHWGFVPNIIRKPNISLWSK